MKQTAGQILRKKGVFWLTVLLLAAINMPCAAESIMPAEEKTVLRVAFPITEGYTMLSEEGQPYGLVVDYLNEIAKYTGWQYEYVPTDGESLMRDFNAGKFDLMGGTYYIEGLEEYFAYPDYNCGYSRMVILARKDDSSIHSYDLRTLEGKTIGVYSRSTENIRRLQEFLRIEGLNCQLKYYSYEELGPDATLHQFLENGEVDLLLDNYTNVSDQFYVVTTFNSQAHYIVTAQGNQEILAGLNLALEKIYASDPDFAAKAYEANFNELNSGYTNLTNEERAYIEQKGTVTVAVPYIWHPMFCLNNSDYHDGFVPDVLQEITAFSGLKFEYLTCESYVDAINKVQQGKADILGFFVGNDRDAADQGLALTASYAEIASILVRHKNTSYPAEGLIGGALEGRKMPNSIMADEVVYFKDNVEALNDVNRGKLDFFYGMAPRIEDIIRQEHYTNIVQVSLVNDNLDISFAMPAPVNAELFSILNKAVNQLTEEQKNVISNRNAVSIGQTHMSLVSLIYANPVLTITIAAVILLLIFAVLLLLIRFRLHTVVMQSELDKAEADSRAKSLFLSRMSHEIRTPMNAIVGLADLTERLPDLPDKAQVNLNKIKTSSRYLLNLINDILDMSRIENGKMTLEAAPFSIQALLDEVDGMLNTQALSKQLTFEVKAQITNDVVIGDGVRLRQVILNLLSNAFKFTPAGGTVQLCVDENAADTESSYTFRVSDNGIGISAEDQERVFLSFEQVGSNIAKSQGTGLGLAISKNIVELMGGRLMLCSELGVGSEFYFTLTLPKGQLEKQPPEALPVDGLQNVHILLAEDNDLNAEIAIELLKLQGAAVTRAENGKKALEEFIKQPPETFQLVLMDILMPEMNGLEACRAIRTLPRPDAQRIPIIAMTANTFKEDVDAAMTAGMTDFVPKPVDVNNLYDKLCAALHAADKV